MNRPLDGLNPPPDNKLGPNCGVTCVALAAGISFQQAWNEFARHHRSGRWKGSTTHIQRKAVLDKLGVKYVELKLTKGCTLKSFILKHASKNKLYMVRTTRHVQMIKDNIISDQAGPKYWHLGGWRLNKHVKNVLLINP